MPLGGSSTAQLIPCLGQNSRVSQHDGKDCSHGGRQQGGPPGEASEKGRSGQAILRHSPTRGTASIASCSPHAVVKVKPGAVLSSLDQRPYQWLRAPFPRRRTLRMRNRLPELPKKKVALHTWLPDGRGV
jgi:hypothetical protein